MKRLLTVFALVLLIVSPCFALSDAQYLKLKKNANFARADKNLTQVWNKLRKSLSPKNFAELQKSQREWIASGRDEDAKAYMKEGYSRAEAYTRATNDRAKALPQIAKNVPTPKKTTPKRTPVRKQEIEEPDEPEEPEEPEDDDDNYGEIEENRFKDSDGPEGNYTRKDKEHGGFMTVLIIDKEEMEAEITISLENPEATWSATGWIDDNVLEVSDKDFSDCQATMTFSPGKVTIQTTEAYGWDTVLGTGNRLDGTYERN